MSRPYSLERRIHAAIRSGQGLRFTADELSEFIECDDALLCRIANTAAQEGRVAEPGAATSEIFKRSWAELKQGIQ